MEAEDFDGICYVTIFCGPYAERRARTYAFGGSGYYSHNVTGVIEVAQDTTKPKTQTTFMEPLRDQFAGQALHGLLYNHQHGGPRVWFDPPAHKNKTPPDACCFVPVGKAHLFATAAYVIADAMLEARAT